ncbi:hypothetical protein IM792_01940 [Mucilaginibacter sp. JRF]|uniref:hypothetical protein n=1 Tax=Mucilaginibacter sp. JRF TaxID=2780088 RepID=UPI001881C833|nr:hypothetical protein [Mucilaginibacter sp. JRF]MBE9583201.1 hypothetical protein [Mucilaginibacter sp. JRF]
MKTKAQFVIVLLCFMLVNCRKSNNQDNPSPAAKTHTVTFNVNSLLLSSGEMSLSNGKKLAELSGAELTKHISHLYVYVNDRYTDEHLPGVHQTADDPNFGTIKIDIPDGEYTVGIVGSRNPSSIDSRRFNIFFRAPASDTFVQGLDIAVNGAPLNENISLERVVGKIKLKFPKLPANVSRVKLYPRGMNNGDIWPDLVFFGWSPYTLTSMGEEGYNLDYAFTAADRAKAEFTMNLYVPTNNEVFYKDLVLEIWGETETPMFSHTFYDFAIERNRITTISGNPFNKTSSFSVKLDGSWLPDTTDIEF